jgi:Glyoxalase-like domain
MAREVQITFDCADPAGLAAFWAEALGYRLQDPPAGFESWAQAPKAMDVPPESRNDASAVVDPEGSGPRLFFQPVPERKQAKNHVHLDVRAAPGLGGHARGPGGGGRAARLSWRHPGCGATSPLPARRRSYRDGRPRGHRVLPRLISRATARRHQRGPPDIQYGHFLSSVS